MIDCDGVARPAPQYFDRPRDRTTIQKHKECEEYELAENDENHSSFYRYLGSVPEIYSIYQYTSFT